MSLKSFLKLVEIQTKAASQIPLILGSISALYLFNKFDLINFLLMFISLLCIDMATTAINNYNDYRTAIKKSGFNYDNHNAIVRDQLSIFSVRMVIGTLILIATVTGLLLFLNTDIVVLLLGVISFIVAILYTSGPIPISRTPFGEIFSGFFMGFIIVFLSTYIHVHDSDLLNLTMQNDLFIFKINYQYLFSIFFISIPTMLGIANIMLANNICDIEDDKINNRYTLPIYIGRKNSLQLFQALYYSIYLSIIIGVIFNILPLFSLITLLTAIIVYKSIKLFKVKQTKKETFVLSVKNFILISIVHIAGLIINLLIR